MSIIVWIVFGLIVGVIASIIMRRGGGLIENTILGVIGAVVGGWIFNELGRAGVTGFNLYSMMVATIGAVLVLVVYHAFRRGRR
jgi:uncharacterized membrane protein YeaQ/YmgE (transglycosylase-associated protein family)